MSRPFRTLVAGEGVFMLLCSLLFLVVGITVDHWMMYYWSAVTATLGASLLSLTYACSRAD